MVFLSRLLCTAMPEVCKKSLMSLRKSTGHSFQHCKKALVQANNDVDQASKWLEEESLKQGWTKLEKIESRVAKEGVLALEQTSNVVAVTEIHCETDFVARNQELRSFAQKISEELCKGDTSSSFRVLPWEEIAKLSISGQSVEEGRARLVAKVGEKVSLARAMVLQSDGSSIMAACHPDNNFGKYGAVMLYKGGDEVLANKVCRHIIGMKPVTIAMKEFLDAGEDVESNTETEDRLAFQEFVFDSDLYVGDVLKENNMEVTKFYRFECAQEITESKEIAESKEMAESKE